MSNNDNNAILKINLNKGKSESNKFNEFYNALFTIFYFILQKPFDSFWWECFSITIQYFQMSIFIIDSTVSIYIYYKNWYSFSLFGKRENYFKKYIIYFIMLI